MASSILPVPQFGIRPQTKITVKLRLLIIIIFSRKQRMERECADRNLPINQIRHGASRGSANDGNLFRSLFRDHQQFFADLCGFPVELIRGIWNVYVAMTARDIDVDPDKYEALCRKVRLLCRKAIPWYPMCVSTHRVLRHSPNMLRHESFNIWKKIVEK